MARLGSRLVAGYYPTPPALVPRLAALVDAAARYGPVVFDPCAGDGEAVIAFADHLDDHSRVVAVELEASRAAALAARRGSGGVAWSDWHAVHGDAFRVHWDEPFADVLYLNPPYDDDRDHGRLEERFLVRLRGALVEGGALVLVVPQRALPASAGTLATGFEDLACWRFPDPEFAAFGQVVLLARRCADRLEPSADVAARVRAWSSGDLPPLPDGGAPALRLSPCDRRYLSRDGVRVLPLDVAALRFVPWGRSVTRAGREVAPGYVPDVGPTDLLVRAYPLAMPPRPAHIASGIAAGVFNGVRVVPDASDFGLPDLLVKGAFDKEFVTVDERHDKKGVKTAEVQVQQPRLVVTALDLCAREYVELRPSAEVTGARRLADMTVADLIAAYGRGLMAAMLRQCPVLHDPARDGEDVPLAPLARPLFRAQADATRAAVKLLGGAGVPPRRRHGRAAFVLGEIGVGKSSVALATAKTIGARRVLVMCPPHLLDSWRDQAAAVVPEARVAVLRDVGDVAELARASDPGMVVALLSREAAKLGHAIVGVEGACPACGAPVPEEVDLARTRARCEARRLVPLDPLARLAVRLAEALAAALPAHAAVAAVLRRPALRRAKPQPGAWERALVRAGAVVPGLLRCVTAGRDVPAKVPEALADLLVAFGDADLVGSVVDGLWAAPKGDGEDSGDARALALDIAFLLPPAEQDEFVARLRAALPDDWRSRSWADDLARLRRGEAPWSHRAYAVDAAGVVTRGGHAFGSPDAAPAALRKLVEVGQWDLRRCGEPLYQAVPEPRRFPLSTYIARRHPRLVDLLVLDEGHELASTDSAQGRAGHRLSGLGMPTLLMTGSVMNGYAESLFANQVALDPLFREEFGRDAQAAFVRRYGYLKRVVEDRRDGKVVAYGSVTDRVERCARTVGQAPGVLPLFVLRYLLRQAVVLQKADLLLDLPARTEHMLQVEPSPEQRARYVSLRDRLVARIKRDRFTPELSGKLWGQMAELPSYLDRATADMGNVEGGAYEVAYPESVGGEVIARAAPLPAGDLLPKEEEMLRVVRAELAEGRRCLVFGWHSLVLPRLQRLLADALGERVPLLDAGRVGTAKRQAWIDSEVVARGARVLVVNPVAVQTGLNNLVHFATQVWMQSPACNPTVYRQAVGRVDRIGQALATRIYYPVYTGTTQEELHRLLMHKVAVSLATDGLDAEGALAAAGVGESGALDGFAVGRQLFELVERQRASGAGV